MDEEKINQSLQAALRFIIQSTYKPICNKIELPFQCPKIEKK